MEADERFMRMALREARRGLGSTSPNPAVGAIIVHQARVIAKGFHQKAGGPHAEIEALTKVRERDLLKGATLYVTLEPCSTHGRTPPCTDAIIAAGIRRVVVGAIDPNPNHRGRGIELLRSHQIEVTTGMLEASCTDLNVGFNRWIATGTPWVIAKVAQSLDGRLTRSPEESRWLTNEHSRKLVHRLRATVDAILVGAETVRKDDPQLTVRGLPIARQPWRVIVTRSRQIPPQSKLVQDNDDQRTLVLANLSWPQVLRDLGARGVTRLLVEGGGDVLGQLLDENLIDEFWCFFAPNLTGGPTASFQGSGVQLNSQALSLKEVRYLRLKDDLLAIGRR